MKEIPESSQSYVDLKSITDDVYSGKRSEYGQDVISLLKDWGINVRQDDGWLNYVNISIPKSIDDAIVIGLRYKKKDDSYTEDHFLFQKGSNLKSFAKKSFEKVAPEYSGTHKTQINQREENISPEEAAWVYMSKDLALINVVVDSHNKIFDNIEINENAYNLFFQLIIDSFSSKIIGGIAKFFDKTNNTWSLYSLGVDEDLVDGLKLKADKLIQLRHKQVAHYATDSQLKNNFLMLSDVGIKLAKETIDEIHKVLSRIGVEKYNGSTWALHWVGVDSSLELMIENLKAFDQNQDQDN